MELLLHIHNFLTVIRFFLSAIHHFPLLPARSLARSLLSLTARSLLPEDKGAPTRPSPPEAKEGATRERETGEK